ncbi:MAG TPA: phospholipid carrier-dependent glycosyltransferase [Steroidobacteraceae bacterium]
MMVTETGEGLRALRSLGWLLWIALAVAWFATMPVRPLLDPDEGRYAEIPREMLASGDWITPRLDGLKYFEKPPLQYWATAVTYSLFGLSEWTARLWTVGLAFLCLPMVFMWTAPLYGKTAALAALGVLAVSPYFAIVGHLNLLDAGFSFWLAGAILAFTRAQLAAERSLRERRWMLAAWAAAALAVLSKGIVVGVLCGATLILYTLLERDGRPWRRLHALWGLTLFLVIAAPWFIVVSVRNPSFAAFFFIHEHFARFLTTVHQRVEPWWYFILILLLAALPWLAHLPRAATAAWVENGLDRSFKPLKFLLIFSAVTLVFFSASGSKLAPYILPLMPPLAIIVGVRATRSARFPRAMAAASAAYVLALSVGLALYVLRINGAVHGPGIGWLLAAALMPLSGVIATYRPRAHSLRAGLWMTAAGALLGWQCLLCAFTDLLPQRSAYRLLLPVKPLVHAQTELFSVGQYRETISPYLQRTMQLVDFQGELQFGLSKEPGGQLSDQAFLTRWHGTQDAIAFLDPASLAAWRRRGLEGEVISADQETVALSRMSTSRP